VQQSIVQLEPNWINLNGFLVWLWNVIKWIFSVHFFVFMYILTTLVIIALITLILFVLVRMYELKQEDEKQKALTATPTTMPSAAAPSSVAMQNVTWQEIRERLLSSNDSDWKLAIIEADIYVDKILDNRGFHGDTTSDKLRQVTPDKLPSIQLAIEAHKIRNRIAHDGSAFVLTMPEARRLLSYFEIIFTDLGVI
jgi:hypothetical protein